MAYTARGFEVDPKKSGKVLEQITGRKEGRKERM